MKTNFNIHVWQIIVLLCLVSVQSLFSQKVNAHLPLEWQIQNQTPATHLVLIPAEVIKTLGLSPYDCIGAFTEDGHYLGVLQVNAGEKNYCLTLYGDDPFTSVKDGFTEGESISLWLIAPSSGKESAPELQFDPTFPNQGYFAAHGVSKVKTGILGAGNLDVYHHLNFSIFPNPANDQLTIQLLLEKPEPLLITVLNVSGQQMTMVTDDRPKAGAYQAELDISNWPAGVYFCRVQVGNKNTSQKIIKIN